MLRCTVSKTSKKNSFTKFGKNIISVKAIAAMSILTLKCVFYNSRTHVQASRVGKSRLFNTGPHSYASLKDFPKLCNYLQGNFWN